MRSKEITKWLSVGSPKDLETSGIRLEVAFVVVCMSPGCVWLHVSKGRRLRVAFAKLYKIIRYRVIGHKSRASLLALVAYVSDAAAKRESAWG